MEQGFVIKSMGLPGISDRKGAFKVNLNDLPAKIRVHLIVCSQVLCLVNFYPAEEIFRTPFGSLSLLHSLINTPQWIFKLRFCLCFPQVITHDGISVPQKILFHP